MLEELIVDGIDVSCCDFAEGEKKELVKCIANGAWLGAPTHYCREYPDCSFKKLLKENKNLKDELSTYGATGICETCSSQTAKESDILIQGMIKLLKEVNAL